MSRCASVSGVLWGLCSYAADRRRASVLGGVERWCCSGSVEANGRVALRRGRRMGDGEAWEQMEEREVEMRDRVWVMAEEGAGGLVSMHPPRVQVKPRPRQSACGRFHIAYHRKNTNK